MRIQRVYDLMSNVLGFDEQGWAAQNMAVGRQGRLVAAQLRHNGPPPASTRHDESAYQARRRVSAAARAAGSESNRGARSTSPDIDAPAARGPVGRNTSSGLAPGSDTRAANNRTDVPNRIFRLITEYDRNKPKGDLQFRHEDERTAAKPPGPCGFWRPVDGIVAQLLDMLTQGSEEEKAFLRNDDREWRFGPSTRDARTDINFGAYTIKFLVSNFHTQSFHTRFTQTGSQRMP